MLDLLIGFTVLYFTGTPVGVPGLPRHHPKGVVRWNRGEKSGEMGSCRSSALSNERP